MNIIVFGKNLELGKSEYGIHLQNWDSWEPVVQKINEQLEFIGWWWTQRVGRYEAWDKVYYFLRTHTVQERAILFWEYIIYSIENNDIINYQDILWMSHPGCILKSKDWDGNFKCKLCMAYTEKTEFACDQLTSWQGLVKADNQYDFWISAKCYLAYLRHKLKVDKKILKDFRTKTFQ